MKFNVEMIYKVTVSVEVESDDIIKAIKLARRYVGEDGVVNYMDGNGISSQKFEEVDIDKTKRIEESN